MFLESVAAGLGMFTHWQTYAAGLIFSLLTFGPILLFGIVGIHSGKAAGAVGCLSMLFLPFLQAFASVVFILTMSPILLGLSQDAAWSFPWVLTIGDPWWMVKFVGALTIAAIVLAIIPVIGRLQSLQTFLLGSIALTIVVGLIGTLNPAIGSKQIHHWPGAWFVVGLCVVSAVMAWLATVLTAIFSAVIDARVEGMGILLVAPVHATFGFIPVFIYGAWLGSQIRG